MTSDPNEENQENVDSGWVDLSERNGTCESTLTANQRFQASLQKIINDCQDILKELQMKMVSFCFGDFSRKVLGFCFVSGCTCMLRKLIP